ncbi:YycH family regulatory protein [Bacillus xiapuensis]|uniref:YycH family regulatory protein n=1 Tax=Bacillus xiapuensis TaxID=2014075 RepID=UPI000C247D6A|nr:two-component system activity regulator YycH [Bacillus xiapuensis]
MSYEKFKSLALAVLVLTSIILTLSIWNYQPHYETRDEDYIHEVSISETREAADLIKPTKLLFHGIGTHFGTTGEKHTNDVMKELGNWTFYEPKNISKTLNEKEFDQVLHGSNRTELVFPSFIPFSTMNMILNFSHSKVPNAVFDRIVVSQVNMREKKATVYFVSTKERLIFASQAVAPTLPSFKKSFMDNAFKWGEYVPRKLGGTGKLFLPLENPVLHRYKYYPDYIEAEKFKDALFTDPSFVKKGSKTNSEEYTDGSSLMRVYYDTNKIFYVNPAREPDSTQNGTLQQLIDKSINFVNEHSGWTDQYRLFEAEPGSSKIGYRLFIKGKPVFNDQGMAKIEQIWGKEQIYQYTRPYFTLDISLPSEEEKLELADGLTALNQVKQQKNFNPKLLEDMAVGYYLQHDPQTSKIIVLEPGWFYKYGGQWKQVPQESLTGGNADGLE